MLRNTSLSLLLLFALACSKDKNLSENLPAPVKQVIEESNCVCDPYIDLYKWRGQQLYFFGYKGPACNWAPRFVDGEGKDITLSQEEIQQFHNEATKIKNIWTCAENP
ncbi:hypothetical protein GCM10023231_38280 [Olivibacter ginsenosidimutans]|uniref:Uncharacterized protein n=1 Tax=Olivibacter ginsenosidimutans TaxID=1176537 RepID=A0ABP9C5N3_9SPHI